MKHILTPIVGVNFYPEGDYVAKRCVVIDKSRVVRIISLRHSQTSPGLVQPGMYLPGHISELCSVLKSIHSDWDVCYVLDRDVLDVLQLEPQIYVPELRELGNVWIPQEWSEV